MSTQKRFLFLLFSCTVAFSLFACICIPVQFFAPPEPTTIPTLPERAVPTEPVPTLAPGDEEILASIRQSLDLYSRAYNDANPDLLVESVDQTNRPFRRLARSRYTSYQESSYAGEYTFDYQVVSIEHKGELVIAHVLAFENAAFDWPFRLIDGRWLLSEPSEDEIGEMVTTTSDNFIFEYYPWSEDVTPEIMGMLTVAARQVEEKLGKIPSGQLRVRVRPFVPS